MSPNIRRSSTPPSDAGRCYAQALSNTCRPSQGGGRPGIWAASLLYAALLIASTASAATISVSSELQAAINSAQPGDTLLVAPGVYSKITLDKSLSLVGDGAVIQAGERDACVNVLADGVAYPAFWSERILWHKTEQCQGCTVALTHHPLHSAGIALLFSDRNTIRAAMPASWPRRRGWYGIPPTPMTISPG